jgi:hypothetical protein
MSTQVNPVRVMLMVCGVVALIPATVLFGLFGFAGMMFFLLLVAMAK